MSTGTSGACRVELPAVSAIHSSSRYEFAELRVERDTLLWVPIVQCLALGQNRINVVGQVGVCIFATTLAKDEGQTQVSRY